MEKKNSYPKKIADSCNAKFDVKNMAHFFNRSYKAVDGLWFLKIEERYGFETALEIDKEIWKIMPKIQARIIISILELGSDWEAFKKSMVTKLTWEGFKFEVRESPNGFQIEISECPWHDLMLKSGREKFSEKVGTAICSIEYSKWASEFEGDIKFNLETQKCKDKEFCLLNFSK